MVAWRPWIEISSSMLFSAAGVMMAGMVLVELRSYLELIPGMLILIPSLLNLKGCIASSLASRLSSAYHLGLIGPQASESGAELKQNLLGALGSILICSLVAGLMGFLGSGESWLIPIGLIAGIGSGIIMCLLSISFVLIAGGRGIDPDNVTIPLLTTFADMITTTWIFLAAIILLGAIPGK